MAFNWNRKKLDNLFGTHDKVVQWCSDNGLIATEKNCPKHHTPMTLQIENGKLGRFRCNKGNCKGKRYIQRATGTWFEGVKIELSAVMSLCYSFARDESYDNAINEAANYDTAVRTSRATVADWYQYARELICEDFLEQQDERGKIGGINRIVQIDETKVGKRKFHKGRKVEGAWLVGMIEDGSEDFRIELCPNNERSAKILHAIIQKHIEGSILHTDYWKGYLGIEAKGYKHERVNHSDPEHPFVDEETGVNTNRIESSWRPVKDFFRTRQFHPENLADHVVEYQWRRYCRKNNKDPFDALIESIRRKYGVNMCLSTKLTPETPTTTPSTGSGTRFAQLRSRVKALGQIQLVPGPSSSSTAPGSASPAGSSPFSGAHSVGLRWNPVSDAGNSSGTGTFCQFSAGRSRTVPESDREPVSGSAQDSSSPDNTRRDGQCESVRCAPQDPNTLLVNGAIDKSLVFAMVADQPIFASFPGEYDSKNEKGGMETLLLEVSEHCDAAASAVEENPVTVNKKKEEAKGKEKEKECGRVRVCVHAESHSPKVWGELEDGEEVEEKMTALDEEKASPPKHKHSSKRKSKNSQKKASYCVDIQCARPSDSSSTTGSRNGSIDCRVEHGGSDGGDENEEHGTKRRLG